MREQLRRTPFGNMLANYRFKKRMAIEKAQNDLWKRNKLDNPAQRQDYQLRESEITSMDGVTTHRIELWKRVDIECVRISTSVDIENVKEDDKSEDSWL